VWPAHNGRAGPGGTHAAFPAPGHRPAEDSFQRRQTHGARAQQVGFVPGEIEDGGFQPHPAGPPVEDEVHRPVKLRHHVFGAGGA
jgi:hypothetical protein